MIKSTKYLLIIIVIVAFAALVAYIVYKGQSSIQFLAEESSLNQTEEGKLIFSATIKNRGDVPIKVYGCGYGDSRCSEGCAGIDEVAPGQEFEVEIECDAGVTSEELRSSGFYIRNTPQGESSRTTTSGSPAFPNFTLPNVGSSWTSSSSRRSSSSSSSSSASPNPTGGTPGGSTGGNTAAQTSSNLPPPVLVDISGDTRQPFYISDTTPTIQIETPQASSSSSTISCRWSNSDQSYSSMPPSNFCTVNRLEGEGICSINSVQAQGIQEYHFACSEMLANGNSNQNSLNNNLDISGTIDSVNPAITLISPLSGTIFPSSINSFHLYFTTNEWTECRATNLIHIVEPSFNSLPISCGQGTSSNCLIPLTAEDNYITLTCRDRALNVQTLSALHYRRFGNLFEPSQSMPVQTAPTTTTPTSTSDSGVPEGTVSEDGTGNVDEYISVDSVPDAGGVVRNFDSEHTIFEGIINLFKKLFNTS